MRQKKATPQDEELIYDENADPVERASAISRLAFDKYYEMEPLLAKLLHHSNYVLRSQALQDLLGRWGKEKYFDYGMRMLKTDPEWSVRADAAFSLSQFIQFYKKGGNHRDLVLRELANCVASDKEWAVQKKCYEEIVLLHNPEKYLYTLRDFDRERDVDWELLKPYMPSEPSAV